MKLIDTKAWPEIEKIFFLYSASSLFVVIFMESLRKAVGNRKEIDFSQILRREL